MQKHASYVESLELAYANAVKYYLQKHTCHQHTRANAIIYVLT